MPKVVYEGGPASPKDRAFGTNHLDDVGEAAGDRLVAMRLMKKLHPKGTKRLKEVFTLYARFNSRGPRASEQPGLTSGKFAKLCKECGILKSRHISLNDVDVAYAQVKDHGRSTISFGRFKLALHLLAQHIVDDDASDDEEDSTRTYDLLVRKVEQNDGPALTPDQSGSPPPVAGEDIRKGSVYEKLVDHKRYIGAHRKRFDETGHGNGIFGRKPLREFTLGMHQLVRPQYGGAAVLKDANLTTDVIQQLGTAPPPAYMKPVHRGRSLDSMKPLKPALKFDRVRGSNFGWH